MGTKEKHGTRPSVRRAIKKRGKNLSYIGVLHSNKNNQRLVISGLVAFVHLVLAEGNPDITGYSIEKREAFASVGGETRKTIIDAEVFFRDGHVSTSSFAAAKCRTGTGSSLDFGRASLGTQWCRTSAPLLSVGTNI